MDNFYKKIIEQSKLLQKTIVLPEVDDQRVIDAASYILKNKICRLILIGNKEELLSKHSHSHLETAQFIEPETFLEIDSLSESLFHSRKHKGLNLDEAKENIKNPLIFGLMLVKNRFADGLVAGAAHPTAHVIRPTLQLFKNESIASSFFILSHNNNVTLFSDCSLNINPSSKDLSQITIDSVNSFQQIVGQTAKVALLSYSTHCTHQDESCPVKVKQTLNILKEIEPSLIIDGDIQADAAISQKICKIKSPDSPLNGQANVLIFPDLASGNISYKLVQQFTQCNAFGPILQGINAAVNDLSRGCTVDDIVGTICITSIQSSLISN